MESFKTHYPSYDVMAFQEEWDSFTREIILKRLGPFPKAAFLTKNEEGMLALIAEHLTYDNRKKIIAWILYHIDAKLVSETGEAERKPEVPLEKVLVRDGLKFINTVARQRFKEDFATTQTEEQFQILSQLQTGQITGNVMWQKELQKELFKKLAELIISAYYSHPTVWSEIGYGGPAYPRGYYRVEFGLRDPWEAKKEDATFAGFGEEGARLGE